MLRQCDVSVGSALYFYFSILANVIISHTVTTAGYAAATADLEFLVVKRKAEAKSLANRCLGTETR